MAYRQTLRLGVESVRAYRIGLWGFWGHVPVDDLLQKHASGLIPYP